MNTYSPSEFNLQAQVANIRRKLFWARKNHPHLVATGRMSSIDSDKDIACMQATVDTLTKLIEDVEGRLQPGLFDKT